MTDASAIPYVNVPARRRFFYGWVSLVVAALAMVATLPGRTFGLGLVTEPLLADLKMSADEFALINLWATLIGASFALACGPLIDRLGARKVLVATHLLLGAAVIAMSQSHTFKSLAITTTLTRGLGQSMLSVISLALVGKWFSRRLGMAMAIYSVVIAIGFIIAYVALGKAISPENWRQVWRGIGWVQIVLFAPLALLLARDTPESIGASVDGEGADPTGDAVGLLGMPIEPTPQDDGPIADAASSLTVEYPSRPGSRPAEATVTHADAAVVDAASGRTVEYQPLRESRPDEDTSAAAAARERPLAVFAAQGRDESHPGVVGIAPAVAFSTLAFWAYALASAAYALVATPLMLFNERVLTAHGMNKNTVLGVMGVITLFGLIGNFGGGWLARRWSTGRLLCIAMALLALSLVALPLAREPAGAYGYAVLMGLSGGIVTVGFFMCWGKVFGRRHLGTIQGAAQVLTVLGSALGPLLLTQTIALTGSSSPLFFALAPVLGVLALLCAIAKEPTLQAA